MPPKQGGLIALTKYIAAYVDKVPLAWDAYVKEKSKGTEQAKAERVAMRSVYPEDPNIGVRLNTWKKHKFWVESAIEEIRKTLATFRALVSTGIEPHKAESEAVKTVLKDYPHASEALEIWKRCGAWSEAFFQPEEEFGEVPSKTTRQPQERPSITGNILRKPEAASGVPREQIMAQLRSLLAEISVEERKWFGKATGKAPEEDKFLPIGAKLPPHLVLKFKSLTGRYAHHMERALKLYLMVLESAER